MAAEEAAEAAVGGSRLLGTQAAQQAVDSFTGGVHSLAASIQDAVNSLKSITGSSRGMAGAGGSITSQPGNLSFGSGNGGQVSFPGAASGFGGSGSGQFAQTMLRGGGNGGQGNTPDEQSPGTNDSQSRGRIGGAVAFSAFSDLSRYGNRKIADMVTIDYLGQRYGQPAGMSQKASAMAMFGGLAYGQGVGDIAGMNASIASMSTGALGSAQWRSVRGNIGGSALANPDMSASQVGQAGQQLGSARSFWNLQTVGINTLGAGSNPASMMNVANQISARSGYTARKLDSSQYSALFSQNSHLSLNFQNLVSSGRLTQDQADIMQNDLRIKQQAVNGGLTSAQADSLIATAGNGGKAGNSALATLHAHGVLNTSLQAMQQQQGRNTTQSAETSASFNAGLQGATAVVGDFTNVMNKLLNGPLGKIVGYSGGSSSVLGGAAGNALGSVGSTIGTLGAAKMLGGLGSSTGSGSGIGGMLGGISKSRLGIGAGIGVVGNIAGGLIKDGNHGARDKVGGILSGAATGAGIGMLFGPAGAAVGGLIGGIAGAFGAGGTGGDPSGVSTNPGVGTLRTAGAAVQWAQSQIKNTSGSFTGMCDKFVASSYGLSASGYGSAKTHWANIPGKFKHTDHNPPLGAIVFWDIGANGHVALSSGGGNIISTDIKGSGTISMVPVGTIEQKWNARYLGWSVPYYQGRTTAVGGTAASMDNGSVTPSSGSTLGSGNGTGSSSVGSTSEAANVAAALGAAGMGSIAGAKSGAQGVNGNGTGANTAGTGTTGAAPSKGALTAAQVKNVLMGAGFSGSNLNIAMAVTRAESGWRPGAVGGPNYDGTHDYGLFQMNSATTPGWAWSDPASNAAMGYKLESHAGWGRWATYNNGAYQKYMKQYKSGAWDIDEDQTAQIHKGEMVLDAHNAQTVRNALLSNNGMYSAAGSTSTGGVTLSFNKGSVVIQLGDGVSPDDSTMRRAAQMFAEHLSNDARIKKLQAGL